MPASDRFGMRRWSLAIGALTLACLCACVTPDSLMKRSLSRGGPDEEANARMLAEYAADTGHQPGLRAWALRATSRLKRQPPDAIEKLGGIVSNGSEDRVVRAWAAYALGELRRPESIPYFRAALSGHIDSNTGYYVLDGLAKVLPDVLAKPEVTQAVAESMTTYAAHQRKFTTDMYDLLNGEMTNLRVLVDLLHRAASGQQQADQAEIYTVVYRTFQHLANPEMKKVYTVRFAEHRTGITNALELSFGMLPKATPGLSRLASWYVGMLGDSEPLAGVCADHLVNLVNSSEDPRLKPLAAWSLYRMEVANPAANEALVKTILGEATDDRLFQLLGALSPAPGQPDPLQQALNVRLSPAGP